MIFSRVVTGAGSGIGLSAVKLLLADSRVALVVAVDLQTDQLEELAAQGGSRLHIVQGDVSQRQTNKDAVEAAVHRTGTLEAVVLNAGILGPVSPVTEGDVDGWKKTFDINFFGPLHGVSACFFFPYTLLSQISLGSNHCDIILNLTSDVVQIQTAFPHLSKSGGRIILTSSGVSLRLTKSWAAYSCSKAALNHLCASFAHEEPSISAVSVTPGIVDTGIQKLVRDQRKFSSLLASLSRSKWHSSLLC
jgi:NAD(P)-dependent dehydrogenase (short-subunit alcohol dehydrogenase family)